MKSSLQNEISAVVGDKIKKKKLQQRMSAVIHFVTDVVTGEIQ